MRDSTDLDATCPVCDAPAVSVTHRQTRFKVTGSSVGGSPLPVVQHGVEVRHTETFECCLSQVRAHRGVQWSGWDISIKCDNAQKVAMRLRKELYGDRSSK